MLRWNPDPTGLSSPGHCLRSPNSRRSGTANYCPGSRSVAGNCARARLLNLLDNVGRHNGVLGGP
eukprot:11182956-Lingulodinium_polyedra.AAC.1